MNRRHFVETAGAMAAANALGAPVDKPAKLSGSRQWPVYDQLEERALMDVLRSGKWYRGSGAAVSKFEQKYAELTGAKHCLAVANGTSALLTSLSAMEITAGDEVILPPYTFVATLNAILEKHALPVFVDSDRNTFQMDAKKLEAAITPRTKAIIPVHLGGSSVDVDAVLAIAKKHNVPVLEDACQSHLGEWKNRKVGTWGTAGCFSFQASKNLNSGEGGAVLTNDDRLYERCYAFHTNSSPRRGAANFDGYSGPGLNLRMPEFQGALLVAQMSRLEAQSRVREQNAEALTKMLEKIPGIHPARMYAGCTRNAYHLYMFRYEKEQFAGQPRAKFLKALAAEGIPASSGYTPLNKQPLIATALGSRGYGRLFSAAELKQWPERNQCPENDRLCEEAVWFTQTMLLGPRSDMEVIAGAIERIQKRAAQL